MTATWVSYAPPLPPWGSVSGLCEIKGGGGGYSRRIYEGLLLGVPLNDPDIQFDHEGGIERCMTAELWECFFGMGGFFFLSWASGHGGPW